MAKPQRLAFLINACGYCHGVHEATAREFGFPEGLMLQLIEDIDRAPVDE